MANQQFLAKIQLKSTGPLTYTGRGRTFKRGVTIITTTDPVEADYFRSQWGFSVEIKKGKLAAPVSKSAPDDNEVTEREDEEAEEEEERDEEVSESYEEVDLKKMKRDELIALIDDDDDLDMKSSDLPKKAGKPEIIEAILEAQGDSEDDDDEEDDDEDEE